jgi:transposase-like protein
MSEHTIDVVPHLIVGRKSDGRCVYDREAKEELVRRCQQPAVSVAGMALAHGLNANLLRKWITASRGGVRRRKSAPALLPVTTIAEPVSTAAASSGYIEVVLPSGCVRVHGRVSPDALQVVIDCLSRQP